MNDTAHSVGPLLSEHEHESDVSLPRNERVKVGLALAGGGFRASFFHLGVFHRLAELDLLRRVEVISTVSGGSIIGALFVLLLRAKRLEVGDRRLDRADYLAIIQWMEETLQAGVDRNLRNRLFANPLALLRVVGTPFSLGNRMARLYERYLYRDVVERLRQESRLGDGRSWWRRWMRPGAFPLHETRPVPQAFTAGGSVRSLPGGREAFNQREADRPDGSAVPHLVLNATSMNSGGRFSMSSSEIGDWYLGYARHSQVERYRQLKPVREAIRADASDAEVEAAVTDNVTLDLARLARWVAYQEAASDAERAGRLAPERLAPEDGHWSQALDLQHVEALVTTAPGQLREAQIPAWHLRRDPTRTKRRVGGRTTAELRRWFRAALAAIDEALAEDLDARHPLPTQAEVLVDGPEGVQPTHQLGGVEQDLMDLVIEVFALRGAAAVSPRLGDDLDALTIGDAVGASACFPPVFSPFIMQGIYDDARVGTLGLTDGGVFDNAGLTALLDEHCTCIIASDTGGAFDIAPRASTSHARMVLRLSAIMQADQGRSKRVALQERRRLNRDLERIESEGRDDTGGAQSRDAETMRDAIRLTREQRLLQGLAFFHIETPTPEIKHPDRPPALELGISRHLLARMRTDLDGFGEVEIAALVNRGYLLADASVRRYLGRFEETWAPEMAWSVPPAFPCPAPQSPAEIRRATAIVRAGGKRVFRSLRLLPDPASFVSLAVVLGLVGMVGAGFVYRADLAAWAMPPFAAAASWLREFPAWIGWRGWSAAAWVVAAASVAAGVAAWRVLRSQASARLRRWVGRLRKYAPWVAAWSLLAVVPEARPWAALGLGLVVLGLPLYALVNHLFFYLPFRRASRIL